MKDGGKTTKSSSGYAAGARAILPLSPAVFLFGASFGVLARSAGFDPVASIVMSATTFAGSAQFAVVSVFAAGGTVVAAIAAAVLLNARYGPMGLAAARSFRGGVPRRVGESQLLVDESWAVSQESGRFDHSPHAWRGARAVCGLGWRHGDRRGRRRQPRRSRRRLGSTPPSPHCSWRCSCRSCVRRNALAAALAGGGIALLLIPVTPAGVPVIAATCGVLFGLLPERGERLSGTSARHAERRRAVSSEAPS